MCVFGKERVILCKVRKGTGRDCYLYGCEGKVADENIERNGIGRDCYMCGCEGKGC